MSMEEIKQILQSEKLTLFKAIDYIISFYTQIYNSFINLRDNLFTSAFSSNQTWKADLDIDNATLRFPEYNLQSVEGEIQNNSENIIVLLNNVRGIQNRYLQDPEKLTIQDIHLIKKVNQSLLDFILRLYSRDNMNLLSAQRLTLAKAVKNNIVKIIESNITPFIDKVEIILVDEYKITMRPLLRRIIGNHGNYTRDPFKFDILIKEKCTTSSIEYHQDIILSAIADLAKSDDVLVKELRAKYVTPEAEQNAGHVYKLKEIANRSIAQVTSLTKLEAFLIAVHNLYQPFTIFQRIMNFLKKMITGKSMNFPKKDLYFFYSSRSGRIEKRKTSIQILIKDIAALKGFLSKVKETIDFYSYTKTTNAGSIREMENVIDNSISALNSIYTQCLGLRDWLVWKQNVSRLDKIPVKQQEEFNDLLLGINYHLIISKQNLRDMMRKG